EPRELVSPDEGTPESEPADIGPRPVPVIHLPDPDLGRDGNLTADEGDESTPAKKRTRRGTRGGRNRRKKPAGDESAAADENGAARDAGEVAEEEPATVAATPEPEPG